MTFFQSLLNHFIPPPIKCNEKPPTNQKTQPKPLPEEQQVLSQTIDQYDRRVGPFQQLTAPLQFVTHPEPIKGFKLQFAKMHSSYFQTLHVWQMPNSGVKEENSNPMMATMGNASNRATYTFSTQLVKDVRKKQPHVIMVSKLDTDKKLQAIYIQKLNKNWSIKLASSIQSQNIRQGLLSFDIMHEDEKRSYCQLKILQPYQQFCYSQKILKNLILSFDYTNLMAQRISCWSYGFKAFIKNNILISNYQAFNQQFNIGYKIPIRNDIIFGANFSHTPGESLTSVGFHKKFLQSEIMTTLNTKGELTTNISLKILFFQIKLGAFADYKKEKYSFGYGIATQI